MVGDDRTLCEKKTNTATKLNDFNFQQNQIFNSSKIFLTTTSYVLQYGIPDLQSCDSVQQIVFDGVDNNVSAKQFYNIVDSMDAMQKQVCLLPVETHDMQNKKKVIIFCI